MKKICGFLFLFLTALFPIFSIGVVLVDLFLQKSSVSFVLLVAGAVLPVIGVVYLFLRGEKRQVLFCHETDEKRFRYLSGMMGVLRVLLIVEILFKAVKLFYL